MKLEDLNISAHTNGDPCGRVFFYKERILRAINPDSEHWVREFLSSELYGKLVENGWFVKTWIVDDVQLEGCSLIIESEKVYACQWQLHTFEQMRDAAILAIKINTLCKQYGWALWDCWLINFGLKNGQLIYFDLGGFYKKGERLIRELLHLEKDWKVLCLMSIGMHALAKCVSSYSNVTYSNPLFPLNKSKLDDELELQDHPFLFSRGRKYQVFRKRSNPALFCIRTRFAHGVINGINRIAECITKKSYPWRLFYVEPKDRLGQQDFEYITPYYQGYADIEYLGNEVIKYFISQISTTNSQPKSILLYGEYHIEDIELLRNSYKWQIWVCSPLLPYTDMIYREIMARRINIGVLSFNFCFNNIRDNSGIIELGIDGLLCHNISLTDNSLVSEPTYFLGKFVKYFNQVFMANDGECNTYVKKNMFFEIVDAEM